EAPLVPSGTIFFSGCNFKCVFCQNDDISTNPGAGMVVNPTKLSHIAKSLKGDGARNINYVGGDPIPNLHVIIESLKYQDDNITQLWNSNFYNTMDALNLLADVMDFWLPDLKYGNSECAKRLSLVDDYWEVLTRNLKHVHDQMVGKEWASLVIRHLVLPDHVQCCSFPIINWVSENLPNAMINIMGQYRPTHKVPRNPEKYSEITRRPSRDELLRVKNLADELGVAWKAVS
ncbi:MAG: radical SAM protein, partial [Candidatus Hodarchaeota archaeon]